MCGTPDIKGAKSIHVAGRTSRLRIEIDVFRTLAVNARARRIALVRHQPPAE